MSDTALLLIAGLLVVNLVVGFLVYRQIAKRSSPSDAASLQLMQQQVDGLRSQVHATLESNAKLVAQQLSQMSEAVAQRLSENASLLQSSQATLGQRLDHAARVVGEVQNKLGQLDEASRRIFDVGKDIASLQEILRAPKLRGGLGELSLEKQLEQVFPPNAFATQYSFKSGERVDAVIFLRDGMIPIDAKFPLESFKRILEAEDDESRKTARKQFSGDVRKHIDAIAKKYILPEEGTLDFALMYIPAENVYYETIIKDESFGEDKSISSYSLDRRVIPVSPNSIYAYLQAILIGLRGMQVEESAKEIIRNLQQLQSDFEKFHDDFTLIGKHLNHAHGAFEDADKRLGKLEDRVERIAETEATPVLESKRAVASLEEKSS